MPEIKTAIVDQNSTCIVVGCLEDIPSRIKLPKQPQNTNDSNKIINKCNL